jgi:hypothetical protein
VSLALASIIAIVCLVGVRRHGCLTLVGAFLAGCATYSVPAVIGLYMPPFHGDTRGFAEVSFDAQFVVALAWITIGACLHVCAGCRSLADSMHEDNEDVLIRVRTFRTLCLLASAGIYLWIAVGDHPLYFLRPRQTFDISMGPQKLLWRWVNSFGLVASLAVRSKLGLGLFSLPMMVIFLAGDRTMLLLATTAVMVHAFRDQSVWRVLMRWQFIAGTAALAILLWAGKPIYLAVKMQSFAPIEALGDGRLAMSQYASFEPLLVHALLEDVIRSGFAYPIGAVLMGALGQLLVVPSAFDIDSGDFNVAFTAAHYDGITYGLAFNYWAEAYSVGGLSGVVLFAALLTFAVCWLDRWAARVRTPERIVIITMGAVLAVYVYRNSLENTLAFIRQILIVGMLLLVMTHMLVPMRRTVARAA